MDQSTPNHHITPTSEDEDWELEIQLDVKRQRVDDTMSCSKCLTSSTSNDVHLKCCGECRRAWYCSKKCQLDDWKSHKPTCKLLVKSFSDLSKFDPEGGRLAVAIIKWADRYTIPLCHAANQIILPSADYNTGGHLLDSHALVVWVKETPPGSGKFVMVSAERGELNTEMDGLIKGMPPGVGSNFMKKRMAEKKNLIESKFGRKIPGFLYVFIKNEGMFISHVLDFYISEDLLRLHPTRKHKPDWAKALRRDLDEDVKLYRTEDGLLFELHPDDSSISRGQLGRS